ncbi:unnamed protein product [Rotaria socialis]|uniref:GRIP domain-containing protein n=1 Tax=Rotaria socialis TaxID=392032 RepID=A0A820J470_9BILA|nr:unnamed protein product [Rotaria socialis]CAF4318786.1 unnamed protein product [Rotaria socialis]
MSSWWNTASASNFTRGLTSITGQLSTNLKDILTEASEENYDPTTELTRARQHIEDLELRKQAFMEECTSLKKQCDELTMQKQAVEIKSDMLLAESRRAIEEKDNELKRLRETTNAVTWNNPNDSNNTWTDILEDDQSEINEYLKYQRTIRELKDENSHLRDEMANLRMSFKSQKSEKNQFRQEDNIIHIEQMYAAQLSKCRQEYDEQILKLQLQLKELKDSNENHEEDELRKTMEVQKEVDEVDKDLLSQELEQANEKLNWYSEKLREYSNLHTNMDSLMSHSKQLENDLLLQQQNNESYLKRISQYEETINQLQQDIVQLNAHKNNQEQEQQTNNNEDFNRLLIEERHRCDALATDNEAMFQLLEETRLQNSQIENSIKERFQEDIRNKEKQIEQLNFQIHDLQDQIQKQINHEKNEQENFHIQLNNLREEIQTKEKQIDAEKNEHEKQIHQLSEEKNNLLSQVKNLEQFKDEQLAKQIEEEEDRLKEFHVREMFEKQLIELHEDLQTLENKKNELYDQIDELKEQIRSRDKQIQTYENSTATPGSPAAISSSPGLRTRSPSPQTFEHVLELEAQILRNEQQFCELKSVYDRFATLLPIEISQSENHQVSLSDRFLNLFEQWSTYVDTLSITQQELESLKQLLIEKQEDLEKLQFDLDLTTTKLIELQQQQPSLTHENKSLHDKEEENEVEIEHILELHQFSQRAPSRQSIVSSTPGEKQQLIAQNELLSSLLAEKDRELISLQQAEKTREDLIKNLEALKIILQQIELDKEIKQVELNDIRNVLDEKLRENSSLKKEKMHFIEKLSEMERDRQEQQSMIQITHKQSSQEDEKPSTSITLNEEDKTNTEQIHTKEQHEKLRADYDQLVEFSKRQHDESLSYYNEYTRILSLHNELNTKFSQLQIDYESVQSLVQQKNEAYLQCQNELNNYQNLLYHEKKKSEEVDLLRATLIERDTKLQQMVDNETQLLVKQSELERDIKLLEKNNFELRSVEQSFIEQLQQMNLEHIQSDLKNISHERNIAIANKKQLEDEIELNRQKFSQYEERERKLTNEIERLRTHLLKMEESYTTDLIVAEDREKSLRNQIAQLDDTNRAQNELIQQLNTSGEQSKQTLATELGTLKYEYTKLEALNTNLNNQLQYQMKCSQNLQNVLEQFKREREQHINEHLRQYQDALREQTTIVNRLTNENNEICNRLAEYNEALSAAHRLNDQIEKKDSLINTLRNQIHTKDEKIQQYEYNLRDLQSTSGSRVEKQLVKNILLSYFHTPVNKRQEVIPLLGALVGFTQDEYKRAIDATSTNNNNSPKGGSGWLGGWLGGNVAAGGGGGTNPARARTQSETPVYDPNKSFTELLIQYVDQQSTNNLQHPTAKFNTDEYLHRYDSNVGGASGAGHNLLRKSSVSASANPFVNSSHLHSNKPSSAVVLPTLNGSQNITILNPPPLPSASSSSTITTATSENTESSSTILKDLLKT